MEHNCLITLKKLSQTIQTEFGMTISTSTIGRHLQNCLFSVKKVTPMSVAVNNESNKNLSKGFFEKLLQYSAEGKAIFYQDETNLNLFTRRSRGRAVIGEKAVILTPSSKGPNIHCIGLYSNIYGLAYFERRPGCFKQELFQDWFSRALYHLRDTLNISLGNIVIVIDNAPCHSQIEAAVHRNLDFIGVHTLRMAS